MFPCIMVSRVCFATRTVRISNYVNGVKQSLPAFDNLHIDPVLKKASPPGCLFAFLSTRNPWLAHFLVAASDHMHPLDSQRFCLAILHIIQCDIHTAQTDAQ